MGYYETQFKAEHILSMELQGSQKKIQHFLNIQDLRTLENEWGTALMKDGKPIVCAGAIVHHPQRAEVWSFLNIDISTRNLIVVYRFAKRFLAGLPFNRIEATVDYDFLAGIRAIEKLGFKMEAPRMRNYLITGGDAILYSKVRS